MKILVSDHPDGVLCVKSITYGDIYGCHVKLENYWGDIKNAYPTKILCDNNEDAIYITYKHLKYVKENGNFVGKRLNRRINNYVQRLF